MRKVGVEEWLVQAVMALYDDSKTVVKTSFGCTDSFCVKVGVHQGSVLSPLLFTIVMEAISKEFRVGLPWELLYADYLVIMAESEEELVKKILIWNYWLEKKGMKVNIAKTKVMVSNGKELKQERGKWPCGVCGKGVGCNSIQCTKCVKWIHKKCWAEESFKKI